MAMAALWRRPIVATDLDALSVRVARENAKLNGLGRYLKTGISDGYHSRLIQREGTVSASSERIARVSQTSGAATACW